MKIKDLARYHATSQVQGRAFASFGSGRIKIKDIQRKHITSMTQGRAYFDKHSPGGLPIGGSVTVNITYNGDNVVNGADNIIHIQG